MVTVTIPAPGQQAHSAVLTLCETVIVSLPAIALCPGKYCRANLEWVVDRSAVGIPGASWKLGKGRAVRETIELPEPTKGAIGVRLALFTEVEASTTKIEGEASIEANERT